MMEGHAMPDVFLVMDCMSQRLTFGGQIWYPTYASRSRAWYCTVATPSFILDLHDADHPWWMEGWDYLGRLTIQLILRQWTMTDA